MRDRRSALSRLVNSAEGDMEKARREMGVRADFVCGTYPPPLPRALAQSKKLIGEVEENLASSPTPPSSPPPGHFRLLVLLSSWSIVRSSTCIGGHRCCLRR
jgi:hypothetical protein